MKRPLALFGLSLFLIQMAIIILPQEFIYILVAVLVLCIIITLILRNKIYKQIIIIFIAFVFSFLLYHSYNMRYVKPVQNLIGENINFTATVIKTSNGYSSNTVNAVLYVNSTNANIHNFKINALLPVVKNGDIISFNADVIPTNNEYLTYYYSQNIYASIENADDVKLIGLSDNLYFDLLDIQNNLSVNLSKFLPTKSFSIANAMVLGNDVFLNDETELIFRNSGLSHILVISGLHISLLSNAINIFVSKFTKRKTANVIIILLCGLFVLVSGITASAIRAFVIITLFYLAKLLNQKSDVLTALAVAAIILCVNNPYSVVDAGTLLSFTATFGVLSAANFTYERKTLHNTHNKKQKFIDVLIERSAVPFAASIATLPILAAFGFAFSLVSVFSNIIVMPFIPIIVIGGLILCITAQFSFLNVFSIIISAVLNYLIYLIYFVADIFANLPWAVVHISGISAILTFIFAVIIFIIGKKLKVNFKINSIMVASFVLICGMFYYIYTCNIVQIQTVGTSTQTSILITQNTKAALIFTGRSTDIDDVEQMLLNYNINELEVIFDLTRTYENNKLSEILNTKNIYYANEIINNQVFTLFNDIEVGIHHQEYGNYASVNINGVTLGITANKVNMAAYEQCDIFVLGAYETENLSCDTIWLTDAVPTWWQEQKETVNYNTLINEFEKLYINSSNGNYKWEVSLIDIK